MGIAWQNINLALGHRFYFPPHYQPFTAIDTVMFSGGQREGALVLIEQSNISMYNMQDMQLSTSAGNMKE